MLENTKNSIKFYLLLCFSLLLFAQCANMVTPGGGEKDVIPPKVIVFRPENNTKEFSEREISIEFDEFFILKDASNKYTVNPILKYPLDLKVRNKELRIKIKDTLDLNETYTINLDDCIQDLNENNALPTFSYVFSTGSIIDSLTVKGIVKDAYTQQPEKNMLILFYKQDIDSLPYKSLPYYYTKTDNDGNFVIHNMKKAYYKVFILKDINKNFKYDRKGERIAFLDTLVMPKYEIKIIEKDTNSIKDTLNNKKTIVKKDTTHKLIEKKIEFPKISIFSFVENKEIKKLLKADLKENKYLQLIYTQGINNIQVIPVFPVKDSVDFVFEQFNDRKDSVYCWIKQTVKDSLKLIVVADNEIRDTLRFRIYDESKEKDEKDKKPKVEIAKKISPKTLFSPSSIDYFKAIDFEFTEPTSKFDLSFVSLELTNKDVQPKIYWKDSLKRFLTIEHKWIQDSSYKFVIRDSALYNWQGNTNDSIQYTLRIRNFNDYGFLKVTIKDSTINMNNNLLFELCDEQYKTKYTNPKVLKNTVVFELINAGTYKLRIIEDKNKNGIWDSGDYMQKQQPEKIIYHKDPLIIKSNWDTELDW